MENQDIEALFAKASRLDKRKQGNLTEGQWAQRRRRNGAKTFKRRALGVCGLSSVKSLDEMAQLLYETGIVSSIKEGRELTPSLVGTSVTYSKFLSTELGFDKTRNSEGKDVYRVYVLAYD